MPAALWALTISIRPCCPCMRGSTLGRLCARDETRGGITIHRLSPMADAGEVVLQQAFLLDFTLGLEANREQADRIAVRLVKLLLYFLQF